MKPIRIALTKGRLQKQATALFKAIGIQSAELGEGSRKLVLKDDAGAYEFILAKSSDVATYVEYGTADIGVVGKDTLLEQERDLYEVMDLKIGQCRFALAALPGFVNIGRYQRKKIATKYPNVARNYFRQKGEDIEIIKIEGSVELAPILGLTDGIVDIVETGTTLRENGLIIIEEICPISGRLIVNKASMKMQREKIQELIFKLQAEVSENNV